MKYSVLFIVFTVVSLVFFYFVERIIQPEYFVKSIIKAGIICGLIISYSFMTHKNLREVISLHKPEKIGILVAYCFAVIIVIGLIIFLFRNQIDWSGIRRSLVEREGLNEKNTFFVYLYIVVVNSFLEEALFRGFIPKLFTKRKAGWIVSAVLFAFYHIGIVGSWFNILIFILCIAGMCIAGLILQWLCEKYKSLAASYMVHASANMCINMVGNLLLLGILD